MPTVLKNQLLEITFPFLFLHSYDATLVAKNKQIACGHPIFFFFFEFFLALNVLDNVRLDFFHTKDFGSSEHAKKR